MYELHPLTFIHPKAAFKIFRENKLSLKSLDHYTTILLGLICFSPIHLIERLFFYSKIEKSKVHPSPLFILGHWRSGTTYIQTLLTKDNSFGYLCGYQAFMPGFDILNINFVNKILRVLIPSKRNMDNMPRGLDIPEEEEFTLTSLSSMGSYHSLWFPHNESYFEKYTLFKDMTEGDIAEWKKKYLHVLKRIVFFSGKDRLILKNPPNTARIDVLEELFPAGLYVHIYRNPYDVIFSMKNMYNKSIKALCLNPISDEQINAKIIDWYVRLMKKYLNSYQIIDKNRLIEIKYEDFEESPLKNMKAIYSKFNLNFDIVEPAFKDYLKSIVGYKKNKLYNDPKLVQRINENCKFIFEHYGYEMKVL